MNPMTDTALPARRWVVSAALMALFLGAMDALIVSAAMPTIIAELGGLDLYAWVYSAYFLARAVALPVFGKLADLYDNRSLFLFSIALFLLASAAAGAAPSMSLLVVARVFQGLGAGGNFALVYIVLSHAAAPGRRAQTLSLASSIWGIASVLGPSLGGFVVTYFSWRWIFFINLPLGFFSLVGIARFLRAQRARPAVVRLDFAGIVTLTGLILSLLTLFIVGGRNYAWLSPPSALLAAATVVFAIGFFAAERRAVDPLLDLQFFRNRSFALGNAAVFCSSFAIFALFAYAPLFIQGALGRSPLQVGLAMLSLSLGWSIGSLVLGQVLSRLGRKAAAISGALLMAVGCGLVLTFSTATSMTAAFFVFQLVGLGMGFVTLSTLLVVQRCLPETHLGVATSSHQFARTLGGTIGIGICGGVVTARLLNRLAGLSGGLAPDLLDRLRASLENIFRPEFMGAVAPEARAVLQGAVVDGLAAAFWIVLMAAGACLVCGLLLPSANADVGRPS